MINLLVADSHPIVRQGIDSLFNTPGSKVRIVDNVESGTDVLPSIKKNHPDVVLLELDLPHLNGLTILRRLRKENPTLKVVVFSSQPEEVFGLNSIKAGALGYIPKTASNDTIAKAIERVYENKLFVTDNLAKLLEYSKKSKKGGYFKRLSKREAEVLKLISEGKKNKEIAEELAINEKTVSTYKARLMTKLNVTNIVDLINQASLLSY